MKQEEEGRRREEEDATSGNGTGHYLDVIAARCRFLAAQPYGLAVRGVK